jgi:hypothetical protein
MTNSLFMKLSFVDSWSCYGPSGENLAIQKTRFVFNDDKKDLLQIATK